MLLKYRVRPGNSMTGGPSITQCANPSWPCHASLMATSSVLFMASTCSCDVIGRTASCTAGGGGGGGTQVHGSAKFGSGGGFACRSQHVLHFCLSSFTLAYAPQGKPWKPLQGTKPLSGRIKRPLAAACHSFSFGAAGAAIGNGAGGSACGGS